MIPHNIPITPRLLAAIENALGKRIPKGSKVFFIPPPPAFPPPFPTKKNP